MPFRARDPRAAPLQGKPDAAAVKRRAIELGADLAGIASAATLNAFPPKEIEANIKAARFVDKR